MCKGWVLENALLHQAIHDLRGNFSVGYSCHGSRWGEQLVLAGAMTDPTWKPVSLYGGLAISLVGFAIAIYTFFWIKLCQQESSSVRHGWDGPARQPTR